MGRDEFVTLYLESNKKVKDQVCQLLEETQQHSESEVLPSYIVHKA